MKASVPPREDMAKIEMRSWSIEMPRMKYLILYCIVLYCVEQVNFI